jgi:DNA-directed RNA polymerase specialized sigma24 family protein
MYGDARHRLEPPEAFRLFYPLLAAGDEAAWAFLYRRYHNLAAAWVRRHAAFHRTGETPEFFVNAAFAKLMAAMRSERFAGFDDVSALLGYLRMCAASSIVDVLRRREPPPAADDEGAAPAPLIDAEDDAMRNLERQELWRTVARVAASPRTTAPRL